MKRFLSLIFVFVFFICTMIPSAAATVVEDSLITEWFSRDYQTVYFAPSLSRNNSARLTYVAEGTLGPGQMGFVGPYVFDTISMSIEYTPISEDIAYGITTNQNTLAHLDFRVATGGSGSATLYTTLRSYYVMVANKSDTTMQFTLSFVPTATVK